MLRHLRCTRTASRIKKIDTGNAATPQKKDCKEERSPFFQQQMYVATLHALCRDKPPLFAVDNLKRRTGIEPIEAPKRARLKHQSI